jgi:hypothetical protein
MDPELGQTLGRASLRTSCGSCGARRASATRQTDLELGRVLGAIPAVRELLKAFASPAGAVITVDALHTQSDTARAILGHGADSVMTDKANMPTLHRKLRKLPWAAVPAFSSVTTGHGRRAGRTIKVTLVHAWIEFGGAAQVAQVRLGYEEGKEDRGGRVPDHQRPRRRSRHPGRLGPGSPGDRKPPAPGQGRDLPGRQIAGQDGKRAPA